MRTWPIISTRTRISGSVSLVCSPFYATCACWVQVLRVDPDQWTARTADGALSAQWEHTILVTADGYEVLTLRDAEEERGFERRGRARLSSLQEEGGSTTNNQSVAWLYTPQQQKVLSGSEYSLP